METWSLAFTAAAEEDFKKLDAPVRRRIAGKLEWLRGNFHTLTPAALGNEWHGYFKLRIGDWRVIYWVDWAQFLIVVYAIGNRDNVYRAR